MLLQGVHSSLFSSFSSVASAQPSLNCFSEQRRVLSLLLALAWSLERFPAEKKAANVLCNIDDRPTAFKAHMQVQQHASKRTIPLAAAFGQAILGLSLLASGVSIGIALT